MKKCDGPSWMITELLWPIQSLTYKWCIYRFTTTIQGFCFLITICLKRSWSLLLEPNLSGASDAPVREGSLFTGWGAGNNENCHNSRKSPYFRLIFTQHIIWPLRNLKQSTCKKISPPLNDVSNPPPSRRVEIFSPPLRPKKLCVQNASKTRKNVF